MESSSSRPAASSASNGSSSKMRVHNSRRVGMDVEEDRHHHHHSRSSRDRPSGDDAYRSGRGGRGRSPQYRRSRSHERGGGRRSSRKDTDRNWRRRSRSRSPHGHRRDDRDRDRIHNRSSRDGGRRRESYRGDREKRKREDDKDAKKAEEEKGPKTVYLNLPPDTTIQDIELMGGLDKLIDAAQGKKVSGDSKDSNNKSLKDALVDEKEEEEYLAKVEAQMLELDGSRSEEERKEAERRRKRRMEILERAKAKSGGATGTVATMNTPLSSTGGTKKAKLESNQKGKSATSDSSMTVETPNNTRPASSPSSSSKSSTSVSSGTPMDEEEKTGGDDDDQNGDGELFANVPVLSENEKTRRMQERAEIQRTLEQEREHPSASARGDADVVQDAKKKASTTGVKEEEEDEDSDFDMFSVSPSQIDTLQTKQALGVGNTLVDSWDDADGYYKFHVGDILNDRYVVFADQGRGVFSSVYRVKDKKDNDKEYVIKVIRNKDTMRKAGMRELELLDILSDNDREGIKFVVRLVGHFDHKDHLCLVFEALHKNLREVSFCVLFA